MAAPATLAPAPAATRPPPRNALSLQVVGLTNHQLMLQYERHLAPYVSLVTALGRRWSGLDDYDVTETSFGVEGRLWVVGRLPFTRWSGRAMVGPYFGVRVDAELTKVTESATDRFVGSSYRLGESLSAGLRIVLFQRIELTPSLGTGIKTELDPRGKLAAWSRLEIIRFGGTAGILF